MDAVKSPGDIVFVNFGAGGIKSHSKTPLVQLCTFPKRGMSKIPGADLAEGFFPSAPGLWGFGGGTPLPPGRFPSGGIPPGGFPPGGIPPPGG